MATLGTTEEQSALKGPSPLSPPGPGQATGSGPAGRLALQRPGAQGSVPRGNDGLPCDSVCTGAGALIRWNSLIRNWQLRSGAPAGGSGRNRAATEPPTPPPTGGSFRPDQGPREGSGSLSGPCKHRSLSALGRDTGHQELGSRLFLLGCPPLRSVT